MIVNPLFIDFWYTASHVQRTSGGTGKLIEVAFKGENIKLCVKHQCLLYWVSLSLLSVRNHQRERREVL